MYNSLKTAGLTLQVFENFSLKVSEKKRNRSNTSTGARPDRKVRFILGELFDTWSWQPNDRKWFWLDGIESCCVGVEGSSKSICVRRFSPSALSLFRFHLSPFPQKRLILRLHGGLEISLSGFELAWKSVVFRVFLGSISAVSRVRSLILPLGGWVRAHFPEQRLVIEPSVFPAVFVRLLVIQQGRGNGRRLVRKMTNNKLKCYRNRDFFFQFCVLFRSMNHLHFGISLVNNFFGY